MREIDDPYSPLKVFHHQDKLSQIKKGIQPVPPQVQLIISDLCNQDCSFCAYRMSGYTASELFTKDSELATVGTNNPKRQLTKEKVFEILEDCAEMGVKAIQFTGGGEPTIHPDFGEIYEKTLSLGLTPALVTNGVLLHKYLDVVEKSAWVRVSIDAGREDTYSSIRRVSKKVYRKVFENVRELVLRRRSNPHLTIGLGFVVTKENWDEVFLFAEQAKAAGAQNIRFSGVFQPEDAEYFKSFYRQSSELCKRTMELETPLFRVFNLFGERVEDLEEHSPNYSFCGYQNFNTYIGGDLNVYRCCVQSYSNYGKIGSLKNQSFKELWNSEEKERDFAAFDARKCERCQFNNKNRAILYALSDSPKHVDFV